VAGRLDARWGGLVFVGAGRLGERGGEHGVLPGRLEHDPGHDSTRPRPGPPLRGESRCQIPKAGGLICDAAGGAGQSLCPTYSPNMDYRLGPRSTIPIPPNPLSRGHRLAARGGEALHAGEDPPRTFRAAEALFQPHAGCRTTTRGRAQWPGRQGECAEDQLGRGGTLDRLNRYGVSSR
jgi:hypothetical protein